MKRTDSIPSNSSDAEFSARENGAYRYAFNGQETQTEITGSSSHMSAEFWMYDTRIGRRWNVDPKPIVGLSHFAVLGNNPITFIDIHGDTLGITIANSRTGTIDDFQNENIAREDIMNLLPEGDEFRKLLNIDYKTGNVTFNISEADANKSNDPGVILLYHLVHDAERYEYTVAWRASFYETMNGLKINGYSFEIPFSIDEYGNYVPDPISGGFKVWNNQVENLSREPKTKVAAMGNLNNMSSPDVPIDPKIHGQVFFVPETDYMFEYRSQIRVNRASVVFHELYENWQRTTHHLPYLPERGLMGAHTNAIEAAKKFKKGDHRHSNTPGQVTFRE